jgi:hypothetical protein
MSLFDEASLIVTPNAYKEGKIFAIKPTDGAGDLNVVRATTDTRINSNKLIESVGLNVPNIDYTNGTCPVILSEPQRTNLFLRSQEFSNVYWTKENVTISENTIDTLAPDGTQTADKIITSVGTANMRVRRTSQTAVNPTISVFAKTAGIRYMSFNFGAVPTSLVTFDLVGGVITQRGANAINATITPLANGWYRCSCSVIFSSPWNFDLQLATSPTGNTPTSPITGNGTDGIYLWGSQQEAGAYPTSYIPTVASTITRNLEVLSLDNVRTNNFITGAGGSWYVELENNVPLVRDTGNFSIYLSSTSTSGAGATSLEFRNPLASPSTSRFQLLKRINGTGTTLFATTTDRVKVLLSWNGSTLDIFVNGVKVVNSDVFAFTNLQFLRIQGIDNPVNLKAMMLFPTPITDTEAIQLTTL